MGGGGGGGETEIEQRTRESKGELGGERGVGPTWRIEQRAAEAEQGEITAGLRDPYRAQSQDIGQG